MIREIAPIKRDLEKLESAKIFKKYLEIIKNDSEYASMKAKHTEKYG